MLVIVAPYWNVNEFEGLACDIVVFVIVAPYWNVNQIEGVENEFKNAGNSSSILECKLW